MPNECKGCAWWAPNAWTNNGLCRFNAPWASYVTGAGAAAAPSESMNAVWPTTAPTDWCGQFKAPAAP
jgi:hypothetical protein